MPYRKAIFSVMLLFWCSFEWYKFDPKNKKKRNNFPSFGDVSQCDVTSCQFQDTYTCCYCSRSCLLNKETCARTPGGCTATEMIPTIEMIPATEMTPNHHRNDTYSQSKWSRHKFSEPWLKWTWDFAIYSKFFVYSCKHDSKQRKIEKAIRLITVLYTDFIFKF